MGIPVNAIDSPLHDLTPLYFSPSPQLEKDVELKQDNLTSSTDNSTIMCEWGALGSHGVLTVAAILHFFVFVVIGSLEMALPYWIISPIIYGGLGCEARRNGMAVFDTCFIISWAIKRSRFSYN